MSEDDVFNAETMVDCDVLEASKENVRPLASGRRVTALSSILATPHAHRETKLAASRNRLRINVELALEDEDGDPLEAYCALVNWTVENYPQGPSVESGLIELLEEATRVLKDDRDGRWRNDMKYLKLWLLYASFIEKPTLIYRFLIANEIGTEHGLLYEEYAAVLERDGLRKEADEIYSLGIARKATPLDHLKLRHEEFQKRMMANILSSASTPAPNPQPTSRPALVQTSKPGSSSSRTTTNRSVSSSSSSTTTHSATNGRLQIFVDPTGSEAASDEFATNTWSDIGTRKSRIKENVPETKRLGGTTLKQPGRSKRVASGPSSGTSSSKIAIFRDPGPEEMPPPPVPPTKAQKQSLPPKTPAKSAIAVFVDDQEDGGSQANPSTPMFKPFRDEDSGTATPAPSSQSVPDSVMKVKSATGPRALALTSEAEALRKDPLKNHAQTIVEGGG